MSSSDDDVLVGFMRNASMLGMAQDFVSIAAAIEIGASAIAYVIPIIGVLIKFILTIMGQKQPKGPFFGMALLLPNGTYPTVGNAIIAAQNFRFLATESHDIPTEGTIILTEGGYAGVHADAQNARDKIAKLQNQMLYPFYTAITNLSPVFARAAVGAVVSPPLLQSVGVFGDFYFNSVPDGYQRFDLSRSAGFSDAISTGYNYFAQVLNEAILRVAYFSVLDSPITKPMQGSVNDLAGQLNVTPAQTVAPPVQVPVPVPVTQQTLVQIPQPATISFGALPLAFFAVLLMVMKR